MKPRSIDWTSAEVDADGTLTVTIGGETDDAWMDGLDSTLGWMLQETHEGSWGEITYGPETFRVKAVDEGSVIALRHFLDDAVRHANDATGTTAAIVEKDSNDVGSEAARKMPQRFRDPG
jgi:hypothetical protein